MSCWWASRLIGLPEVRQRHSYMLFPTSPRIVPGCLLGQHSEAILEELGYTADEIDTLEARGVIARYHPV